MMTGNPAQDELLDRYAWLTHIRWPSADEAARLTAARDGRLAALPADAVNLAGAGTKPFTGRLSTGCQACVAGTWSCLFVSSRCTVNCYFCPQDRAVTEDAAPIAEGIPFANADAYVAYLETAGFDGVSFSGGEPLLQADTILTYLRAIRAHFGPSMTTWLYTNGTLADTDLFQQLQAAGLDEIRFNISARAYSLRAVRLARRFFETVTVEIPALPEDAARIDRLLPELTQIGVDHLNVHQLIGTRFNYRTLLARGHTLLRPVAFHELPVHESEMAALRLLDRVAADGTMLPVNYCSHAYKGRVQSLAHRRRGARLAATPRESITQAGYLRSVRLTGSNRFLDRLTAEGLAQRIDATTVLVDAAHCPPLEPGAAMAVRYAEADLIADHPGAGDPRPGAEIVRRFTWGGALRRWPVTDWIDVPVGVADLVDAPSLRPFELLESGFPPLT